MRGTVTSFNEWRGWGFILGEDGKDYFAHYKHFIFDESGKKKLSKGESVEFVPISTNKGGEAVNIKRG